MCAIAGIRGNKVSRKLYKMLNILKHRGMDGSGVFVDGEFSYGTLDKIEIPEGNFALGHDLLSIVGTEGVQPLIYDKFVLICNGEIYNYHELKEELNLEPKSDSDCEIILATICKFYKGSLLHALNETMKYLDGDYAFAVYDGKDLAVLRDPLGVKPVYYGINEEKNLYAFASEKKALWEVGILDVETIPPGYVLYNWKLRKLHCNLESILENSNKKVKANLNRHVEEGYKSADDYVKNYLKKQLKIKLISSVEKRIKGLSKVGVMFSGGIDSTLLAHLSQELGVETILYSVGHEDSADFKFAQKTANQMGLPIQLQRVTREDVKNYLPPVLNAIEEFNLMKLGVGMPGYIAAEMAHADGVKVILSGQGADELFAGYHRYLEFYRKHKEETQSYLKTDIYNLYHVNLERDDAVTMANTVELRVPYLDLDVINMAMNIPMKYKIDNTDEQLRKCILREIAQDLGVPEENVKRPKKAAQYGSGIDKMLRKVLKEKMDYKNTSYDYPFTMCLEE